MKCSRSMKTLSRVRYLDDRCSRSGKGAVHLSSRGHVGDGVQVVHLVHRHGNGGRRQTDGQQGVGHHHKRQVEP